MNKLIHQYRLILLTMVTVASFVFIIQAVQASSWDPTLLVNTESFMELDDGDGASDVYIQFGDSLLQQVSYEIGTSQFSFSDDVYSIGDLSASGQLIANSDKQGDALLTFGNDVIDQTITLSQGRRTFEFSTGASFGGHLSGNTLELSELKNCNTIDTDANGKLICGTDDFRTPTDLYVDEFGDTMEGGLIVDIDTFTGNLLQPDDVVLSADLELWLDANQIVGLSDNDPVTAWNDVSGNGHSMIQGTPGNQPTYQGNEIGGNPVVRFDGIDDYLRDATSSYTARTVFIIQRISSADQPATDLAQVWGNYGEGVQISMDARQTEGFWSFDGGGTAAARCGTNADSYGSTLTNGLACDWNYDTSQMHAVEFQVDESLTATTVGSLFPAFTAGAHQYGGDIAEIIVYSRVLTGAEREGVQNGLANKYSIDLGNADEAINTIDTVAFTIESESTGGPAIDIDIQGDADSPHIRFGSGGIQDTNLYRSTANMLRTDDSLTVSGSLIAEGTLTGALIDGFGLTDCDGVNEKLVWDNVQQQFSCATEAISTLFYAYDGAGGLAIDNTQQPVGLDTQVFADSLFTHSETVNPSEVTVNETGVYRIMAQACVESISGAGGQRGQPRLSIQRDTGGGFADLAGALSVGYIREPTQQTGENLNIEIFQQLDAGDSIQMVITDVNGNEPDEETVADCSRLLMQRIR